MNQNKPEKLYQLSDIDQNTELYKLFEEDINFIKYFISFEKYSQTISNIENISEFINDPVFQDFQQKFETFIQNKKNNSFCCVFLLLSFLYEIRPKLLPVIILISPIAINFYSPYINEIKIFLSDNSKFCHLSYLLFKIIDENQYFKEHLLNKSAVETDIKSIQLEFLKHPEYLTLFGLNLEISTYQEKHNVVLIKEIINIIIQDDYNELVAFLTKHPEFNIHARIQIPTKEPL